MFPCRQQLYGSPPLDFQGRFGWSPRGRAGAVCSPDQWKARGKLRRCGRLERFRAGRHGSENPRDAPNGRPGCVSDLHFWQPLGSLSIRTSQVLPQTPAPACPLTSHAAPRVLPAPVLRQQSVPFPRLSPCVIRAREPRQRRALAIPLLPPLTRKASRVAPSTRGTQ